MSSSSSSRVNVKLNLLVSTPRRRPPLFVALFSAPFVVSSSRSLFVVVVVVSTASSSSSSLFSSSLRRVVDDDATLTAVFELAHPILSKKTNAFFTPPRLLLSLKAQKRSSVEPKGVFSSSSSSSHFTPNYYHDDVREREREGESEASSVKRRKKEREKGREREREIFRVWILLSYPKKKRHPRRRAFFTRVFFTSHI